MPRKILLAPNHDVNKSLGWLGVAWMEFFVRHGPGDVQGQPVVHGEEYTGFIVNMYAVGENRMNNHLLYDSIFLSRPKAGRPAADVAGRPAQRMAVTSPASPAGSPCSRASAPAASPAGRPAARCTRTRGDSGSSTTTRRASRWAATSTAHS